MTQSNNRVMVFGMDGATFDIMQPLLDAGRLPNLARLIARGASGTLDSSVPELSPPAWTSFMTGVTPGAHGVNDFFGPVEAGSYETRFFNASYRRRPPLWSLLSARGRRSCVLNVPFTFPPDPINGVMVSGMDTPSLESAFVHPPEFREELDRVTGGYRLERVERRLSRRAVGRYARSIEEITENRFRAAAHLLGRESWDLFVVVFESTDRAQHNFWKFRDPAHPEYNARDHARYGELVERAYEDLDRRLGELLALVPEDVTLCVMSDHGFGPLYKGVRLEHWLAREGYLRRAAAPRAPRPPALREQLGALLPGPARRLARALLGRRGGDALPPGLEAFAMAGTQVFPVGGYGNLVINLQGRQPQGVVPESEYEPLRARLIAALEGLRDPDTGARLIERVWRREEVYPHCLAQTPDIIIRWSPGYYCVGEQELGFLGIRPAPDALTTAHRWSGNHLPNGVLMLAGPDIVPGAGFDEAAIIDVAPTLMALLGEPVPSHMDGRVLTEALSADFLARHPPSTADYDLDIGETRPFSEAESACINERLKDLGYL
ncbi:alkaline phosphatase family protein [Marichromatium gracile]|uniref:alkaline phosphatase family protein n=1 Tax=Marichromatium gracile TaxID=1048 RepID=UPI001F193E6C|nr:alkaline phosphatase family protein [Marichromatium gracile]MCF1182794.1 alkaline phosphatase family protein [Marichromatium gracile]